MTAKDSKSGTDDKIEIQLEGQNGTFSEWFELDSTSWFYNDFETDLKTTYYAQAGFQGQGTEIDPTICKVSENFFNRII